MAVMPFSNLQGSNFKSCKLPFFLSPCRYLSDIIMSPQVFVKKMSLLDPFFYLNDQRKLEYNYMISLIFRKRIWISFPTWFCQGNFGLYVSVYTFHQFCGPSPIFFETEQSPSVLWTESHKSEFAYFRHLTS